MQHPFHPSDISKIVVSRPLYLPAREEDLSDWPVIACDQHTANPSYWSDVEKRTSGIPSAYHIVLPEIYLEQPGIVSVPHRIHIINQTMERYFKSGVLRNIGECMVLTERTTRSSGSRKGLVVAIDLETYDFTPGNNCLIRATEETVLERIPPRQKIRENALLETSHIMLVLNDPRQTVIEPLWEEASQGKLHLLYDLDLPEGGGHLRGFAVPKDSRYEKNILEALSKLDSLVNDHLLFAVGDGNHSLATAKSHWETIRTNSPENHPARYALVELVNIYDEALTFEPIHRVIFHVSLDDFIRFAPALMPDAGIRVSEKMSVDNAIVMAETIDSSVLPVPVFHSDQAVVFTFTSYNALLTADAVQTLIDLYQTQNSFCRVDYIHGEDSVKRLSKEHIGILLPPVKKEDFFKTVAKGIIFPRKTFSLGEAYEKRYYMECKLIRYHDHAFVKSL
jgi:hypothetical protein